MGEALLREALVDLALKAGKLVIALDGQERFRSHRTAVTESMNRAAALLAANHPSSEQTTDDLRVEKVREALKPFAAFADHQDAFRRKDDDNFCATITSGATGEQWRLTCGDLRRAREALSILDNEPKATRSDEALTLRAALNWCVQGVYPLGTCIMRSKLRLVCKPYWDSCP